MIQNATVLRWVLQPVPIKATHIWAIDTFSQLMASAVCQGHVNPDGSQGTLGLENPKASLEIPGQINNTLLCKACWQAQGLILERE